MGGVICIPCPLSVEYFPTSYFVEQNKIMLEFSFSELNWVAIIVSIVAGQIVSTIWFVALFGEPWAKEYGADSKQQHTKEIPPYTYAVGLVCTTLLVLSIALLQQWLAIDSLGSAVTLGLFIAIGLSAATSLPGYAFLKRWSAFFLALGSQFVMIIVISIILASWK